MDLAAAARSYDYEFKRRDWADHAWLRFERIEEAGGEFATMFRNPMGNEYIFSRDDLLATDWETRQIMAREMRA